MIENINVSALNKKNADFIEAVICLDSNYKKESQIIPPDNGFDIKMNSIDSKGKYCGSTKYWLK